MFHIFPWSMNNLAYIIQSNNLTENEKYLNSKTQMSLSLLLREVDDIEFGQIFHYVIARIIQKHTFRNKRWI